MEQKNREESEKVLMTASTRKLGKHYDDWANNIQLVCLHMLKSVALCARMKNLDFPRKRNFRKTNIVYVAMCTYASSWQTTRRRRKRKANREHFQATHVELKQSMGIRIKQIMHARFLQRKTEEKRSRKKVSSKTHTQHTHNTAEHTVNTQSKSAPKIFTWIKFVKEKRKNTHINATPIQQQQSGAHNERGGSPLLMELKQK